MQVKPAERSLLARWLTIRCCRGAGATKKGRSLERPYSIARAAGRGYAATVQVAPFLSIAFRSAGLPFSFSFAVAIWVHTAVS